MKPFVSRLPAAALLVVVALLAASCGGSEDSSTEPVADTSAAPAVVEDGSEDSSAAAPAVAEDDGFPLTFTNCEMEFTLDSAPQRVMLMEAAAPSLLFAAGAMDRVVARMIDIPDVYYSADEMAVINSIPVLVAQTTTTGAVEVSVEEIIAYDPDLVIGYDTATITHDALADFGIQLYVMPPYCDNPPEPSFQSIVDEVRFYGKLFGTTEIANASADALEAAVTSSADAPIAEGKNAVALYVSTDGSAIYAYSSKGMVHPQMEALGMNNLFEEESERVFEVSIEEVIGRNPEVLVLLYEDPGGIGITTEEIVALVTELPGAGSITAVADGAVYPLLFNFAEPPSPLVVKGLSEISAQVVEDDGFPLTFTNCEMEFTLDSAPQRVLLMEAAAPSLLFAAGAIDRVIARIEEFPEAYYTADEMAVLNSIPALLAEATATGGVEVSVEEIIAFDPDLVIGYDTATITHDALADVGIQLYVMPPFCDNPPEPSFRSIVDEVRFYGKLFGTAGVANASAAALEAAVASAADAPVAEGKTAAALYVTSDGSAIYAYSSLGMVHPQMEALGMTNVFAELSERVPEVSIEEVIGRNPEVLVLLYEDTGGTGITPEEIIGLVTELPGAGSITAVIDGAVYPLLFNFAEPPTPLVVRGLAMLSDQIAG